ncbi:MAG: hypothetical protein V3T20_06990 [Gemmatimonadota bacterium]
MTLGILLIVFTHVARIPIENYWAFLLSGYLCCMDYETGAVLEEYRRVKTRPASPDR